jgi:ABC-type multidrug transport system fused ATPase/permease subunit
MIVNCIGLLIISPLYLFILIPVFYLINLIKSKYQSLNDIIERLKSESTSPIFGNFNETLRGLSTIRSMNKEKQMLKKHLKNVKKNIKVIQNSILIERWYILRIDIIQSTFVFFSLLFLVFFSKYIPTTLIAVSLIRILNIADESSWFLYLISKMSSISVVIWKIFQYIIIKIENYDLENKETWEKENKDWPSGNEIKFEDVKMKYKKSNDDFILKGINFDCKNSEKVGICGRTGAGKSSIINVLFRLYESNYGKIIIDGKDISKIPLQTLRSSIAIIPQGNLKFFFLNF